MCLLDLFLSVPGTCRKALASPLRASVRAAGQLLGGAASPDRSISARPGGHRQRGARLRPPPGGATTRGPPLPCGAAGGCPTRRARPMLRTSRRKRRPPGAPGGQIFAACIRHAFTKSVTPKHKVCLQDAGVQGRPSGLDIGVCRPACAEAAFITARLPLARVTLVLVRKRTWVPQSCAGTYCPRLCLVRASLAREIPGGYLSEEAALIEQAVASRWCVLQVAAQAGWLGHLCQVPLLFRDGVWQAKPGSPSATPKVEAGRCGAQAVGRGAPEDGAQNVEAHHAQKASADREGVLRREYQCHLRAPAAPQTRSCHDIQHDECCLRSQGQVGAVPLRRETAAHPDAEPRFANHMWMHCSLTQEKTSWNRKCHRLQAQMSLRGLHIVCCHCYILSASGSVRPSHRTSSKGCHSCRCLKHRNAVSGWEGFRRRETGIGCRGGSEGGGGGKGLIGCRYGKRQCWITTKPVRCRRISFLKE